MVTAGRDEEGVDELGDGVLQDAHVVAAGGRGEGSRAGWIGGFCRFRSVAAATTAGACGDGGQSGRLGRRRKEGSGHPD